MSGEGRTAPRSRPVEACPVCGGARPGPFFTARDALHGTPGDFRYQRCAGCGTVYQDPCVIPDDVELLYPPDYYTHAAAAASGPASAPARPGAGARDRIRWGVRHAVAPEEGTAAGPWPARILAGSRWLRERAFHDHVLDELLPWRTPAGRALDVGCGSGRLMAGLGAVGWEVEGAEVDPAAAEVARRATGRPVHVAGATALPADLGPFDLVVLSHVLEHLHDPPAALRGLSVFLRPGGRLVVIAPNPRSLMARWFGVHWYHWDPPRHLVLPPIPALRRAGEGAGLAVLRARTLARWAPDTWRHSWRRRVEEGSFRAGASVASTPRWGAWRRLLGAAGEWPLSLVERTLVGAGARVGEELVVVFGRPVLASADAPGGAP